MSDTHQPPPIVDGVRQGERMNLNPEPLKVRKIPVCRVCGKRAPWCSCGEMAYDDGAKVGKTLPSDPAPSGPGPDDPIAGVGPDIRGNTERQ